MCTLSTSITINITKSRHTTMMVVGFVVRSFSLAATGCVVEKVKKNKINKIVDSREGG